MAFLQSTTITAASSWSLRGSSFCSTGDKSRRGLNSFTSHARPSSLETQWAPAAAGWRARKYTGAPCVASAAVAGIGPLEVVSPAPLDPPTLAITTGQLDLAKVDIQSQFTQDLFNAIAVAPMGMEPGTVLDKPSMVAIPFDKWVKGVFHFVGYACANFMEVTVTVRLPSLGEKTVGKISGTRGSFGKEGVLLVDLEVREGGIYADLQVTNSFHYDGYLFSWPIKPLPQAKLVAPGLALPMVLSGLHATEEIMDLVLRDPVSLEDSGLDVHKHTFEAGESLDEHRHLVDAAHIVIDGSFQWTLPESGQTIYGQSGDIVQMPGNTRYGLKATGAAGPHVLLTFYIGGGYILCLK